MHTQPGALDAVARQSRPASTATLLTSSDDVLVSAIVESTER